MGLAEILGTQRGIRISHTVGGILAFVGAGECTLQHQNGTHPPHLSRFADLNFSRSQHQATGAVTGSRRRGGGWVGCPARSHYCFGQPPRNGSPCWTPLRRASWRPPSPWTRQCGGCWTVCLRHRRPSTPTPKQWLRFTRPRPIKFGHEDEQSIIIIITQLYTQLYNYYYPSVSPCNSPPRTDFCVKCMSSRGLVPGGRDLALSVPSGGGSIAPSGNHPGEPKSPLPTCP